MKIYIFLFLLLLVSNTTYSKEYYCFSSGNKSILIISTDYPNINNIKYYPYLKEIKLSKPIKTDEISMRDDDIKPEIYRTMNEIIDGKITGNYTFMSQGYLLYDITYFNIKTQKHTSFTKVSKTFNGINCL